MAASTFNVINSYLSNRTLTMTGSLPYSASNQQRLPTGVCVGPTPLELSFVLRQLVGAGLLVPVQGAVGGEDLPEIVDVSSGEWSSG